MFASLRSLYPCVVRCCCLGGLLFVVFDVVVCAMQCPGLSTTHNTHTHTHSSRRAILYGEATSPIHNACKLAELSRKKKTAPKRGTRRGGRAQRPRQMTPDTLYTHTYTEMSTCSQHALLTAGRPTPQSAHAHNAHRLRSGALVAPYKSARPSRK